MMRLIKNFEELVTSPQRRDLLEIVEVGLEAVQPSRVVNDQLAMNSEQLRLRDWEVDLSKYKRVYLVGFGKGSAEISRVVEEKFDGRLIRGWTIDMEDQILNIKNQRDISKIKYVTGTHPLPSRENFQFTKEVVNELEGKLTERDLVLVVICGGGSAMLIYPYSGEVEQVVEVNRQMLKSGAIIEEMNTVRKKLDRVKGGGLAKILYPAKVVSLIFSDVPGNDLSVIASGPTVKDPTTVEEAWKVIEKYELGLKKEDLMETPKEGKFFEQVDNFLTLSNLTALEAMRKKSEELGYDVTIYSDRLQGEAREVGRWLVEEATKKVGNKSILLAGGETTVTVKGGGKGGRNQELVLGALNSNLVTSRNLAVASVASDGWDNCELAGAIGDGNSKFKIENSKLKIEEYLESNNSFELFEKIGDGIETGRLPSNVSDLMIILRG